MLMMDDIEVKLKLIKTLPSSDPQKTVKYYLLEHECTLEERYRIKDALLTALRVTDQHSDVIPLWEGQNEGWSIMVSGGMSYATLTSTIRQTLSQVLENDRSHLIRQNSLGDTQQRLAGPVPSTHASSNLYMPFLGNSSTNASPQIYRPGNNMPQSNHASPYAHVFTSSTQASPYSYIMNSTYASPMTHVRNALMQYNMHSNYASPNLHFPQTGSMATMLPANGIWTPPSKPDGTSDLDHSLFPVDSGYTLQTHQKADHNPASKLQAGDDHQMAGSGDQRTITTPMWLSSMQSANIEVWSTVLNSTFKTTAHVNTPPGEVEDAGVNHPSAPFECQNYVSRSFLNTLGFDLWTSADPCMILEIRPSNVRAVPDSLKFWCLVCRISEKLHGESQLFLSDLGTAHLFEREIADHPFRHLIMKAGKLPVFFEIRPNALSDSELAPIAIPYVPKEKAESPNYNARADLENISITDSPLRPIELQVATIPSLEDAILTPASSIRPSIFLIILEPKFSAYSSLIHGWFKVEIQNVTTSAGHCFGQYFPTAEDPAAQKLIGPNFVDDFFLAKLGLRLVVDRLRGQRILLKLSRTASGGSYYVECEVARIDKYTYEAPPWAKYLTPNIILNDTSEQYVFSASDLDHPLAAAAAESRDWPLLLELDSEFEVAVKTAETMAPASAAPTPEHGDNTRGVPEPVFEEDFMLYEREEETSAIPSFGEDFLLYLQEEQSFISPIFNQERSPLFTDPEDSIPSANS